MLPVGTARQMHATRRIRDIYSSGGRAHQARRPQADQARKKPRGWSHRWLEAMSHGSRAGDRVLIDAAEAMVFIGDPPVGLQPEQASRMGNAAQEQDRASPGIVAGSANRRIVVTSLAVDAWRRIERRGNARLLGQRGGGLIQPCPAGLGQNAGNCRRRSFNDRIGRDGHVLNERRGSVRILLIERGWSCRLDEVNAENQTVFLRDRAGRAGRGDLRYCARNTALVPDLHVAGAERVIADYAVAVAPVEPASISIVEEMNWSETSPCWLCNLPNSSMAWQAGSV